MIGFCNNCNKMYIDMIDNLRDRPERLRSESKDSPCNAFRNYFVIHFNTVHFCNTLFTYFLRSESDDLCSVMLDIMFKVRE